MNLPCVTQIGFAGFVDQFGDLEHAAMNRRVLQLHKDGETKQQATDAEQQSNHQQGMSVDAEEIHTRQVGQHQVGFSSAGVFRFAESK